MLKILVEILNSEYNLQRATLLEETSWCISNMAGSTSAHVKELIEAKCVDAMIRLFLLQPSYCIIDNVMAFSLYILFFLYFIAFFV